MVANMYIRCQWSISDILRVIRGQYVNESTCQLVINLFWLVCFWNYVLEKGMTDSQSNDIESIVVFGDAQAFLTGLKVVKIKLNALFYVLARLVTICYKQFVLDQPRTQLKRETVLAHSVTHYLANRLKNNSKTSQKTQTNIFSSKITTSNNWLSSNAIILDNFNIKRPFIRKYAFSNKSSVVVISMGYHNRKADSEKIT